MAIPTQPRPVKMVKHYRKISQMTPEDIKLLVRLLCLPPSVRSSRDGLDQWHNRQSEKISQLAEALQRPQDWGGKLSILTNKKLKLTIEDLVPVCAVLCPSHSGLNPWIVHRIFQLIMSEVTHLLNPVREFLDNPTRHDVKLKTSLGEVQDYVDRMNSIQSLWTGPDSFLKIVGENYPPGLAMPHVETKCEACCCSCIGASGQALCDLRAMMYGRSHRHRVPVLVPVVEAWIERFGKVNADRLFAESSLMARDVRHIRRRIMGRKSHRRHRRHRTPYEKRMKKLARMESDLDKQRLSASQVRAARGEIDKKLDDMFGKESRWPNGRQGRHTSASVRAKDSRDDRFVPASDNPTVQLQDDTANAEKVDGGRDECDEFDEADEGAAYKQQDRLHHWYDTFTEIAGPSGPSNVGSLHPAVRQTAAGIENRWAKSQVAMSAVPDPLCFSRNVTPPEGDEDDDVFVPVAAADHGEPAQSRVSDWTDASVHTLATQSTRKSARGRRPACSQAPSIPQVPTTYLDMPLGQGQGVSGAAPSSFYSNDAATAAHPRPPASITASHTNSKLGRPRAHPPSSAHNRRQPQQPDTVVGSAVTAWPGHGAPGGNSLVSEQRTAQSSKEFQACLDQLDAETHLSSLPTATLVPDDSVSAVAARMYHARLQDAALSQHRLCQNQIDADEALARQLQAVGLKEKDRSEDEDDDDDDDDDDEDLRTAIANSRETARCDEERRSRTGRGQFSDLYMPDSPWM
jgi:hypothetical protein